MGACSSQEMKQKMKAKIQEQKLKQQSLAATPNRQTTIQNGMRTPSRRTTQTPHLSQHDITASSLKNINLFLVNRKTNFSSYYSLLKKETKEFPFTTIQHNHTETIRIIKSYKYTDYKYIDQLLNYQLHHPNIVQQFEIYEEQQKYHVVEENNEKIILLNNKIFKHEQDIAYIFSQIVEVIEFLHHCQLTHGHLTLEIFALFGKKYLKLHDLYTLFMKKKPTFEELHYLPPEYFENQSYTEERDIWALGIILYQLLYNRTPYESTLQTLLKLEIEDSKLEFENTISEEAISLLKQLLEKNISKRIKIWDIKKHIWFKKQQIFLTDEQIRETLFRIKESKKINLLQAYLLKYMINNYPPEQLREIYQVFRSLDQDDDGFFSLSELISSYSEFIDQNDNVKKICLNIFSKVDMDRDGKITFSEFILYAMDRNRLIDEQVLQTSFKLLQNKKGVITTECLAQIYSLENKYFQDIFTEFTKKEYINYKTFQELMQKII